MSDTETKSEPSMEEILASIRRIITEEDAGDAPEREAEEALEGAEDEEPVELTRMVDDSGEVVDLDAKAKEEKVSDKLAVAKADETKETIELVEKEGAGKAGVKDAPKAGKAEDGSLVSPSTKDAATASLAQVISAVAVPEKDSGPAGGQRSLEDVVRDALQPELRAWLDQNLGPLVERIVREEIKKMVRRVEDR
jgi:cell pole-organizing protein PopZ